MIGHTAELKDELKNDSLPSFAKNCYDVDSRP